MDEEKGSSGESRRYNRILPAGQFGSVRSMGARADDVVGSNGGLIPLILENFRKRSLTEKLCAVRLANACEGKCSNMVKRKTGVIKRVFL